MNFGALSRGFGTCCLRFKNGVATIPARLASGWLARLCREGVEPSGSLQKVSDHPSSFSGLCLAQGKFHLVSSTKRLNAVRCCAGKSCNSDYELLASRWQQQLGY
jgi:hypothetical protein